MELYVPQLPLLQSRKLCLRFISFLNAGHIGKGTAAWLRQERVARPAEKVASENFFHCICVFRNDITEFFSSGVGFRLNPNPYT